jgi:hypothetical protein
MPCFFALALWAQPLFKSIFTGCIGVPVDLPGATECFLAAPAWLWESVGLAGGIGIAVKDRWISKRVSGIVNRTAFYGIIISAALVAVAFFWPILRVRHEMRTGGCRVPGCRGHTPVLAAGKPAAVPAG